MKKIYLLFIFLTIQFVSAQENAILPTVNSINEKVYNTAGVEFVPEFPGGELGFDKFIRKNFKYPKSKEFVGGRVIFQFTIEKDGSVSNVKVLRDLGFGTAEETIRMMKKCPKWKPAEQDGKKVRCTFVKPILFS
jgi:protein TonB